MDVFALTKTLIDIESITGNEKAVGDWLFDYLQPLVTEYGGTLERIEVEPDRTICDLGRTGCHLVDASGYGAAIFRIARG